MAALASLPLGAALGPEAPLIALGGGLALAFRDLVRAPATEASTTLLGAAGAASAVSAIFGSPLVAAVLLMEVAGVGGPLLFAVMLPPCSPAESAPSCSPGSATGPDWMPRA
jgi:H+/Cl- antiporter ClcA